MSRSPAVKRLLAEFAQFRKDPSPDFRAEPLDDNMFEWHFTMRGPPDTPYAGGIYHGRILLPASYPFKPPDILLLTPTGRFEVNTKICLSITTFHEETWQPAWGIRTALTALRAFFPTPANGAVGSMEQTDSQKARLAQKSAAWRCDSCKKTNQEWFDDDDDDDDDDEEEDGETKDGTEQAVGGDDGGGEASASRSNGVGEVASRAEGDSSADEEHQREAERIADPVGAGEEAHAFAAANEWGFGEDDDDDDDDGVYVVEEVVQEDDAVQLAAGQQQPAPGRQQQQQQQQQQFPPAVRPPLSDAMRRRLSVERRLSLATILFTFGILVLLARRFGLVGSRRVPEMHDLL